jgi:hypothetical protein
MDKVIDENNQRQTVSNMPEMWFVDYMESVGMPVKRFEIDEKDVNIHGFWNIHRLIRSLPDFVYFNAKKQRMMYFHIKGTNKMKIDDVINYSAFEFLFGLNADLYIVFMMEKDKPVKRTMRQIREMMTGLTIAKWHDGKQYVALNLNELNGKG